MICKIVNCEMWKSEIDAIKMWKWEKLEKQVDASFCHRFFDEKTSQILASAIS